MTSSPAAPGRGPSRDLSSRCAAFLLGLALLAGLQPPTAGAAAAAGHARPWRIVLVTIDGLDAGGASAAALPSLAALARRGAAADRGCSPSSLPFPALAEVLSGCGPARTRVLDEAMRGLPATVPTLAGALSAGGYATFALPADPLAHSGTGLARGFGRWAAIAPALEDSARVDSALAWLGSGGRRFAWLGLSFGAPAEAWRRGDGIGPRSPDAFAARARSIETALERLVAGLAHSGGGAATLVAVCGTSDRTEGVPIVFAGPGIAPGRRLAAGTALADVAPTLLAAAGLTAARMDGRDALALPPASPRGACASADAGTSGERAGVAVPEAFVAEMHAAMARPGVPDSAALATWDTLCARAPGSLRLELERAMALSRAGREQPAAQSLKRLAENHPEYPEAVIAYADHLLRFQREELVPAVLARIAPESPLAAPAAWRLMLARAGQLDFVAAIGAATRASALAVPSPGLASIDGSLRRLEALRDSSQREGADPAVRLRYGRALTEFGLYPAAYRQFHAARALMPGSAEPDYWLADALLHQGRTANAMATLQRAVKTDSTHRASRLALAEALMQLDRRHEAREQLERALALDPRDARAQYNLACLRATESDVPGALEALERAVGLGYDDRERLEADPDLATLRGEPRFKRLLAARR